MTPGASRHRLSDWLDLHELSPALCRRLLDTMPEPAVTPVRDVQRDDQNCPAIDIETAWLTTVNAMRDFFPAQVDIIDRTFEGSARLLVPQHQGSRKAVTIDNAPNGFPTIVHSFRGEPADLMVTAHEFAHALQIVASEGRFVSPIMREVCAFVGEHVLVTHNALANAVPCLRLDQVWDADSRRYFGAGRQRLFAALSQGEPDYRYAWNYPIARHLAIEVQKRFTPEAIWALFEGHVTVAGLLRRLDPATA